MDVIVLVVIITALVFDFTNGFHDTANAMATSIATGALIVLGVTIAPTASVARARRWVARCHRSPRGRVRVKRSTGVRSP